MKTLIQMIMATNYPLKRVHHTVMNLLFGLIRKGSAMLVLFVVLGFISRSLDTVVYHVTVRQMNLSNETVFDALGHLEYVCVTARAILIHETH